MKRQRKNNFSKNINGCIVVTAQECGDNADRMVRKFIKKVKKEGVDEEYRARARYKKPSVIKSENKAKRQRIIDKVNKDRTELINPSTKRLAKKARRRK